VQKIDIGTKRKSSGMRFSKCQPRIINMLTQNRITGRNQTPFQPTGIIRAIIYGRAVILNINRKI